MYHSCCFHRALSPCSSSFASSLFFPWLSTFLTFYFLFVLFHPIVFDSFVPLVLSRSISLHRFHFLLSFASFVFFWFLLLSSAFSLVPSYLPALEGLLSVTMLVSLVECFIKYCVSVGKLSLTRFAIVCDRPVHNRCDACRTFAPMKAAELSFQKSHHLACSSACRNVELANSLRNSEVSVPCESPAPAGASKELAPSSTLPLEELFRPLRCFNKPFGRPLPLTRPLLLSRSSSTPLLPFFHRSSRSQTLRILKYKADTLNADHLAGAARLTESDPIRRLRTMFRVGRWATDFRSLPVEEKNPPSHRLLVPPSAAVCRLAVPLYLIDGFQSPGTKRNL